MSASVMQGGHNKVPVHTERNGQKLQSSDTIFHVSQCAK